MKGLSIGYLFKYRLQEYAQKVGLTMPVYDAVEEGPTHYPSYSATVTVDDKKYTSLPGFTNRKTAEHSAAEIALLELSISGPMKEIISSPVHNSGLCKTMLQAYSLKMNHAIPVYTCLESEVLAKGEAHFTCTVDVGGITYVGGIARNKKEAEIKAATTALLAIKHIPGDDTETETPSRLTVIPIRRKVVEQQPKAKEVKKHTLEKKRKRANKATADAGDEQNGQSEMSNSSQVEIPLPEIEKGHNVVSVSCLEEQNDSSVPVSCDAAAAVEV